MHDLLSSGSRASRALPRWTQLLILGAMILLASVVAVFGSIVWHRLDARDVATAAAPAVAPGTFRPTEQQWASLKFALVREMTFRAAQQADGKIAYNDDATTPVFSPYSGRVTKLFAKAGDYVKQGQPLMAIAASEFVQGQNDLISTTQAQNAARAQLKLATINEKRQHELYEAKAGALKDWEQAQADLDNAKANFRTAEIALAAVRNRLHILGKSDQEIDALANAQHISAESVVTAPIGGTVTQRQVGLGQYINSAAAGASAPVFAIGNLSTVWLLANVRESDAPLMRLGETAEVRVLAYPGRIFKAKLTYVAPAVDPSTHRLPVRAEVENSDGALKPEMFASFTIITGEDRSAPAVAAEAIVYEGETARVWVAHEDKTLELRPIRLGRIGEGNMEVLAGLEAGEKVVTSGSLFIDRAAQGD